MMKTRFLKVIGVMTAGLALHAACAAADSAPDAGWDLTAFKSASFHAGLFHPNGVDLFGYSVEERTRQGLYWYYTLGFPSIAAIGLSYYGEYQAAGPFITGGIGIGSVLYGSAGYQWPLGGKQFLKAGVGLTTGINYEGAFPVLSYERRIE